MLDFVNENEIMFECFLLGLTRVFEGKKNEHKYAEEKKKTHINMNFI